VIDNSSDTARVQVALVGAGYWGSRLARNLGAAPSCSVRWMCDLQPASACEVAGPLGAAATTSLMDVLADPAVEAVVVATPASTHPDVVAACLEADRHVLVEKPLAPTANDAQALMELARARGRMVMCDHTYRFAPAVQVVRDLLAAGMLGRLRSVDSVRANHNHGNSDVDVFWDLAHHDLSILTFVLHAAARPVAASARSADLLGMGRAHAGDLTLTLADDTTARVHVDWNAPEKVRTMTFTGDDGYLTWDDNSPSRPRLELHLDGATRLIPVDDHREPLRLVVEEFLAAVTEGRAPSCGVEAEIAVLTTLEAATRSAAASGALASVDIVGGEKR
jgi:predicted dehydrogenase